MKYPTWTAEQIKDELGIPYHDLRVLLKYLIKKNKRYQWYKNIKMDEYHKLKEIIEEYKKG